MRTPNKNFKIKASTTKTTLSAHDREHKQWNRRSFLQALGLVGGGSIALGGASLSAASPSPLMAALNKAENDDRILVLIRLKGGNDGLNTIVPIYDYDTYANNRPTIKFAESSLYKLSDDFGIPQHMEPLQRMWGEGSFKIVHGVGYNEQNLSHFRSADIWASGEEIEFEDTGILGRFFENQFPDFLTQLPEIPPAIQIGSIGNLLFDGADTNYAFSVSNPDQLSQIAEDGTLHRMDNIPGCGFGEQLRFMRNAANTTFTYAGVINQAYEASTNSVEYSEGNLSAQMAIISRMIKGNLGTKIYLVTLDGFDTHANQANDHQSLMTEVADSVSKFYEDLDAAGMADKVLSMTFSEFGRRIFENGSNGTDHGAAAPAMLFGPAVEGNGFIGSHPDLSDPEGPGNLKASIDFRQLYATVLKEWLCLDTNLVNSIILEEDYEPLSLGFGCASLSTPEFALAPQFNHTATYQNRDTFLELNITQTQHVDIRLYDILGREIGSLKNSMLTPGTYKINIKETIKQPLHKGQYIYRIGAGRQFYSKSIMIQ